MCMRDCRFLFFLTFVLTIFSLKVLAAPIGDLEKPLLREPLHEIEDPVLTEATVYGQRAVHQYLGVSIGWLGGQVTRKLNSGSQMAYGFYYSQLDKESELWDAQIYWLSSEAAWIQFGKKFLFESDSIYEPYYRLGISHFTDPEEALAGLFRFDSFKATTAIGLLDVATMGRYWSAELGLHWGLAGLAFHIQSGFQWTF